MLSLPPRPVERHALLAALIAAAPSGRRLGVWCRGQRPLTLVAARGVARCVLLIDGDLGRLLRRCASIAVVLGADIVVASADELARARVLRVAAGRSQVSTLEALRTLFPDAIAMHRAVEIPLAQRSAEEVLGACVVAGAVVARSEIVYRGDRGKWSIDTPSP